MLSWMVGKSPPDSMENILHNVIWCYTKSNVAQRIATFICNIDGKAMDVL